MHIAAEISPLRKESPVRDVLIDPIVVGTVQPERTVLIERGRLQMFALAIGEDDPVYVDVDAARAAGHPDLPVPPTFFFGMNMGRGPEQDMQWMRELGIDMRRILHGEEAFVYHSVAHAGDTVILAPRITDVYCKRNDEMQFIERTTTVSTTEGVPVVEMRELIVYRPQEAS